MQHTMYCKSRLVNALVDFIVCHCVIDCFRLALIGVANQPIRRAADSAATPVQNMCVNRRVEPRFRVHFYGLKVTVAIVIQADLAPFEAISSFSFDAQSIVNYAK